MVRMGEQLPDQARAFISTAVDASEEVADQLASTFRVDVDSADVSEVAAMLAKEMRKEAFIKANGAKFERELVEKYGVLKDIILHPTVQVRPRVLEAGPVYVCNGSLSSLLRLRYARVLARLSSSSCTEGGIHRGPMVAAAACLLARCVLRT